MAGTPPRIVFYTQDFREFGFSYVFLSIRFFSVLQNVAPAAALAPFLAPLSDPIFGAQNAPEPKRKESH